MILIDKGSAIATSYDDVAVALDRIEYTEPEVFGIVVAWWRYCPESRDSLKGRTIGS